jgi:hypothetical protein
VATARKSGLKARLSQNLMTFCASVQRFVVGHFGEKAENFGEQQFGVRWVLKAKINLPDVLRQRFRQKLNKLISPEIYIDLVPFFRQNLENTFFAGNNLKLLSNQQRLHQVNTAQLYENYRAAQSHAAPYTCGMRWKTVRGTEYLFRDRDRRGNGKSFGPRSEQTEVLSAVFSAGRTVAKERLHLITEIIEEQARLNKALRLNRVPRVVARVLRELERTGVHDSFTVIGTQALYAYEAEGGAQFLLELR